MIKYNIDRVLGNAVLVFKSSLMPLVEVISRQYPKVTFYSLEPTPELAKIYEVELIPTFIIVLDGIIVDRFVGNNLRKLESKVYTYFS